MILSSGIPGIRVTPNTLRCVLAQGTCWITSVGKTSSPGILIHAKVSSSRRVRYQFLSERAKGSVRLASSFCPALQDDVLTCPTGL